MVRNTIRFRPGILLVLGAALVVVANSQDNPTPSPTVQLGNGATIIGAQLSNYNAYYGIPFAEPPVANLRFANPVKKTLPEGNFSAVTVPSACPQPDLTKLATLEIVGSEDCLYLNVYQPNNGRTNLDVLFYVHGGAYFFGSAHPYLYGPSYFMNNGSVVLVTTQYRLNALGFLATGDSASPGNYGLKDQAMALQWVKDNIKQFGGNPDSITVAGHSAGSSSVHMLMMSPLSKDNIKAVIPISGSAIGPWNYPKSPEHQLNLTRQHAKALQIPDAEQLNSQQLVERLREVSMENLTMTVFHLKWLGMDPLTLYRPVVEPAGREGAFLTESPYNVLKRGGQAAVPIMFGIMQNEGAIRALPLIYSDLQRQRLNADKDQMIPFLMEYDADRAIGLNFTEQLLQRYNLTNGVSDEASKQGLQQLYTDRSFLYSAYRTLQLHLKNSSSVSIYRFAYRGEHSMTELDPTLPPNHDFGVGHLDDAIYLFDMPALFPKGLNEQDKVASNRYVQDIVQFVMTQTPPMEVSCTKMEPMCDYVNYFKDNTTNEIGRETRNVFDVEMVQFWDQLGEVPLEE